MSPSSQITHHGAIALTPAEFAADQIKPGVAPLPPADAMPIPDPALS